MAWENVGRNRKKAVLVTGSLSLSLMVLNTGYTMANSFDLDKYLDRMISSDFVMGDVSWFNVYSGYTNQDTLSDEFLKTLSSYQGIEAMEKIYFTEKKCELDEHWDTMAERAKEEVGLSGDWLKHMEEEIVRAMESRLLFKRNELALYAAKLESLSPLAKLKQGYAYVTTSDDTTLTDVNQITPGDTLTIYLQNGSVEAQATRVDRREE